MHVSFLVSSSSDIFVLSNQFILRLSDILAMRLRCDFEYLTIVNQKIAFPYLHALFFTTIFSSILIIIILLKFRITASQKAGNYRFVYPVFLILLILYLYYLPAPANVGNDQHFSNCTWFQNVGRETPPANGLVVLYISLCNYLIVFCIQNISFKNRRPTWCLILLSRLLL